MRAWIKILLLLFSTTLFGDTIVLKNGDQMSGKISHMRDGLLAFKTAYGDLSIPWEQVVSVDSEQSFVVEKDSKQYLKTKLNNQQVSLNGTITTLANIDTINPKTSLLGWKSDGEVNAGFDVKRGNTIKDNYSLEAKLQFQKQKHRFKFHGALVNEKNNHNEVSEDTALLDLNYSHYLHPNWFASGTFNYKLDGLDELEERYYTSIGLGHDWSIVKPHTLTTEAGIAYVLEHNATTENKEYPAGLWRLDYTYAISWLAADFFHHHNILFAFNDDNDLFIDTSTGINFPLAKNFQLNFQIDWDWKENASAGSSNDDTAVLTRLGYRY